MIKVHQYHSNIFLAWVYPVVAHWAWDAGNKGCYLAPDDPTTLTWTDCNLTKDFESTKTKNGTNTFDCYNCSIHGAGWLLSLGYNDFAGSGVVHVLGGACSFVACYLVGPRNGRFDENGKPDKMPGHSVPLAALGGFILILGFLAFNGGSQVSFSAI